MKIKLNHNQFNHNQFNHNKINLKFKLVQYIRMFQRVISSLINIFVKNKKKEIEWSNIQIIFKISQKHNQVFLIKKKLLKNKSKNNMKNN